MKHVANVILSCVKPSDALIHPTVSIGGVYQAHPLVEAIHRADKLMYWAKKKRNDVQT